MIAFGQPGAERNDPTYRDVVLEWRLCRAPVRLNQELPQEAFDDAFRRVVRADGSSLIQRNRGAHRILVDGVTLEYSPADIVFFVNALPTCQAHGGSRQEPEDRSPSIAQASYPTLDSSSGCYADPYDRGWVGRSIHIMVFQSLSQERS